MRRAFLNMLLVLLLSVTTSCYSARSIKQQNSLSGPTSKTIVVIVLTVLGGASIVLVKSLNKN